MQLVAGNVGNIDICGVFQPEKRKTAIFFINAVRKKTFNFVIIYM